MEIGSISIPRAIRPPSLSCPIHVRPSSVTLASSERMGFPAAFLLPSVPSFCNIRTSSSMSQMPMSGTGAADTVSRPEHGGQPLSMASCASTAAAKRARISIEAFEPEPFEPFLCGNAHFQTIVSNFYPKPEMPRYTRLTFQSDDGLAVFYVDIANGDSLSPEGPTERAEIPPPPPILQHDSPADGADAEAAAAAKDGALKASAPVAVVLTGLESNSSAVVACRLVNALTDANLKVFVLNHRSCAGPEDLPSTVRLYHAGFTEDLQTLLRAISHSAVTSGHRAPQVYLCGFSLGANIVSHFLARAGDGARTRYHVVAAAGACIPFDPISCQRELDYGWKGAVYSTHLIKKMHAKVERMARQGVPLGKVELRAVREADRLGKIDESFISPVFGFRDRLDYYRQVDARFVLKDIKVPMLIINARDDPFFSHMSDKSLPTKEQIGSAPVRVFMCSQGGHCGFLDKKTMQDTNSGYFQREFAKWFKFVDAQSAISIEQSR